MAEAKSLMDATERLIKKMVKDAGTADVAVADRAKAADAAMKFLAIKHKLVPETEESDFERGLRELHGDGQDNDS